MATEQEVYELKKEKQRLKLRLETLELQKKVDALEKEQQATRNLEILRNNAKLLDEKLDDFSDVVKKIICDEVSTLRKEFSLKNISK
ncbi:MAG: hypothetical protein LBV67_07185 [Streptococcaceae bacterium]|jgi:hypothetical protein|nr:hypothetical protein [Streptococcaceae bacterium]